MASSNRARASSVSGRRAETERHGRLACRCRPRGKGAKVGAALRARGTAQHANGRAARGAGRAREISRCVVYLPFVVFLNLIAQSPRRAPNPLGIRLTIPSDSTRHTRSDDRSGAGGRRRGQLRPAPSPLASPPATCIRLMMSESCVGPSARSSDFISAPVTVLPEAPHGPLRAHAHAAVAVHITPTDARVTRPPPRPPAPLARPFRGRRPPPRWSPPCAGAAQTAGTSRTASGT